MSKPRSYQSPFDRSELDVLRGRVSGRIVLPEDPSYNNDRTTFMGAFPRHPQIIVFCVTFRDVSACLEFAKRVGMSVVCRSSGHSTASYSVNDEMVVDLSGINFVRVNERAGTMTVGAGATWGKVNAELDLWRMHVPGGGCDSVAVAGYVQGGGYGFTSLMYGMSCDSVIGAKVALANGQIVTAEANRNSDLYWAIRGGTGNNFGVLLEIHFKLHRLDTLWAYGFKWPIRSEEEAYVASRAASVWHQSFSGVNTPENLGSEAYLVHNREPGAANLTPCLMIRGLFKGTEAGCRDALEPLLTKIPTSDGYRDIWREGTYRHLNKYLLEYPAPILEHIPRHSSLITKSHIIDRRLSDLDWFSIVDMYRCSPDENSVIGLEPYGGAINRVPAEATAFWHRSATLNVVLFSFVTSPKTRDVARRYSKQFDTVVERLANGHANQNYPSRERRDFGRAYFGGNLARLREVKEKYDPSDLFSFEQGLSRA